MKACAFLCVEVIDVVGGDELDFGPLGERARLIEDQATSTDSGSQRVRHSQLIARGREWSRAAVYTPHWGT